MKLAASMFAVACLLLAATLSPLQAQEVPRLREMVILTTISEAVLATHSLVQARAEGNFEILSWNATYTEREWLLEAQGKTSAQDFKLTMTGYLWGAEGTSWTVAFSGLGRLGEEAVQIHGQAEWTYDPKLSDYRDMDFRQVAKFGSNTFWGWVLGSEIVIGGAIGATGGLVAGPAGSIGGAIVIGSAAVGLSSGAKYLLESDEPVDPPEPPKRPVPPKEGEDLRADIMTAVFPNGEIQGTGLDGVTLNGKFTKDGYAEGVAK